MKQDARARESDERARRIQQFANRRSTRPGHFPAVNADLQATQPQLASALAAYYRERAARERQEAIDASRAAVQPTVATAVPDTDPATAFPVAVSAVATPVDAQPLPVAQAVTTEADPTQPTPGVATAATGPVTPRERPTPRRLMTTPVRRRPPLTAAQKKAQKKAKQERRAKLDKGQVSLTQMINPPSSDSEGHPAEDDDVELIHDAERKTFLSKLPSLVPGYVAFLDHGLGKHYYQNVATGKFEFELPTAPAASNENAAAANGKMNPTEKAAADAADDDDTDTDESV